MKYMAIIILASVLMFSCNKKQEQSQAKTVQISKQGAKIKFLEIGSDKCVPCKQMKEVTANISKKYGEQLDFQFIDINQDKEALDKYKVQLIPTQVFFDATGKEIFRHVGFYPEATIDSLLKANGLQAKI